LDIKMDASHRDITQLLQQWNLGDKLALDRIVELVYEDLRRLARRRARSLPADSSIQPTALVNEVYLRLVDASQVSWQDRAHFFAIVARLMRQVVTDSARSRGREKRGGGWQRIAIEDSNLSAVRQEIDVLALDEAINRLAAADARKAQVVELRVYGGLSNGEIAEVLAVSVDTIKRDWTFARLWLARELKE
jgi:RNA polymerase sigma factor (TIGR02999 family)